MKIVYFIWCIFLVPCLGNNALYAQDSINGIPQEIRTMLPDGEHSLKLIRNKGAYKTGGRKIDWDEYGKVIKEDLKLDGQSEGPVVDFKPVNTLHLKVKYEAGQLQIDPARNSFCPTIRIEFSTNLVYLNSQVLNFAEEIQVLNADNALGSRWYGYRWKSEKEGNGASFQYRFTLGKLDKDGRIYMEIRWLEGETIFHYRLLG